MEPSAALPACTCREVSVQDVAIPLTPEAIHAYLLGKEAYRRTDFVVLRAEDEVAIAAVKRAQPDALFSPITEVTVLALPHETAWVEDPEADVMNATQLVRAARRGGRRAAVVKGVYEHVNFVLDTRAIPLRVFDVVPPAPAKLAVMVRKVLDYAELPAIDVQEETFDLNRLLPEPPPGCSLPAACRALPFRCQPCRWTSARPSWKGISCLGATVRWRSTATSTAASRAGGTSAPATLHPSMTVLPSSSAAGTSSSVRWRACV